MKSHKNEIKVIEGEIFTDFRGVISSVNELCFQGVERFYFIHHTDKSIIRGWHAHQFEKKWFYCVKGSFTLALVKIDDWMSPGKDLNAQIFTLSESQSEIIYVPEGYANCIKANEADSTLLVFSGKKYQDALEDSWRYDSSMWVDWSKY